MTGFTPGPQPISSGALQVQANGTPLGVANTLNFGNNITTSLNATSNTLKVDVNIPTPNVVIQLQANGTAQGAANTINFRNNLNVTVNTSTNTATVDNPYNGTLNFQSNGTPLGAANTINYGNNVTATYNAAANTIRIDVSVPSGGIAVANGGTFVATVNTINAGNNVSVSVNNVSNTATFNVTAPPATIAAQNSSGGALGTGNTIQAGNNVTLTVNNIANTITVAALAPIKIYYNGANTVYTYSTTPTAKGILDSTSIILPAFTTNTTFLLSGSVLFAAAHPNRFYFSLDGNTYISSGYDNANSGDGYITTSMQMIYTVPGDGSSHTLGIFIEASGGTGQTNVYDRWLSATTISQQGSSAAQYQPYNINLFYPGVWNYNQLLLVHEFPFRANVAANFGQAQSGGKSYAKAMIAATANTQANIYYCSNSTNQANSSNWTQIGYITFSAGSANGTFTANGSNNFIFNQGDWIIIQGPAVPDSTLSSVSLTIAADR
jgi:hypothetical protein